MSKIPTLFLPTPSEFLKKYTANLLKNLNGSKLTIYTNDRSEVSFLNKEEIYSSIDQIIEDKSLTYLARQNDFRLYDRYLTHVAASKSKLAWIPRVTHPEFLYATLSSLGESNLALVGADFGCTEIRLYSSRAATYKKLLELTAVRRLLIHHNAPWTVHSQLRRSGFSDFHISKVTALSDPAYESQKDYTPRPRNKGDFYLDEERDQTFSPKSKNYILFFGNLTYGKGFDIFVNTMNFFGTKSDIRGLIAGPRDSINFETPFSYENIDSCDWLDGFIPHESLSLIFSGAAAVALPYRQLAYEYGTSGVLVQAALANRPIVAPSFEPFSSLCDRFPGLGATYEPESATSMAQAIQRCVGHRNRFDSSNYLHSLDKWDKITKTWMDETSVHR